MKFEDGIKIACKKMETNELYFNAIMEKKEIPAGATIEEEYLLENGQTAYLYSGDNSVADADLGVGQPFHCIACGAVVQNEEVYCSSKCENTVQQKCCAV